MFLDTGDLDTAVLFIPLDWCWINVDWQWFQSTGSHYAVVVQEPVISRESNCLSIKKQQQQQNILLSNP